MSGKRIIFIFLLCFSIFALGLALILQYGVSNTYDLYNHAQVGLRILAMVNPIINPVIGSLWDEPQEYIFISGFLCISILFLVIVRFLYVGFRESKSYNYIQFVGFIVLMVSIPLIFDISLYFFSLTRCGNIFFRCERIWHSEENSFGHPVYVSYMYDPKGNKVSPNAPGCSYRGTLENYIQIVELIPKSGKTIAGETTHYFFLDGSSLTIDTLNELKRQEGNLSFAMREAISRIMYKGTSCENIY